MRRSVAVTLLVVGVVGGFIGQAVIDNVAGKQVGWDGIIWTGFVVAGIVGLARQPRK